MKNIIASLLLLSLSACKLQREQNLAEMMVMAQAPKAICKTAHVGGSDVAICDVPGKDKVVQFVAVYNKGKTPFQVFAISDGTEKATPPPAPAPATPPATPSPATPPQAPADPVGSGAAQ